MKFARKTEAILGVALLLICLSAVYIASLPTTPHIVQTTPHIVQTRTKSNDSQQTMDKAEAGVQERLAKFARTDDPEALSEAQTLAFSMNPNPRSSILSALDERCLRLQLKVLVAAQNARDMNYDPKAWENLVWANIMPPDSGGQMVMAGMDPKAIRNPVARKKYEDAIEANIKRNLKSRRERDLSRCVDHAVIGIWNFVRNFPDGSEARTKANYIIGSTVTDKTLVARLQSQDSPGLTW